MRRFVLVIGERTCGVGAHDLHELLRRQRQVRLHVGEKVDESVPLDVAGARRDYGHQLFLFVESDWIWPPNCGTGSSRCPPS